MLTEKEKTAALKIANIITNNPGLLPALYTVVGGDGITSDNVHALKELVFDIVAASKPVPRETTIEEKIAAALEPLKKEIKEKFDELILFGETETFLRKEPVNKSPTWTAGPSNYFDAAKLEAQIKKLKKLTPNSIAIGWTYDIIPAQELEKELIEMLKKYCALQRESCVQAYLRLDSGKAPYLGKIDIQNASEPDFK